MTPENRSPSVAEKPLHPLLQRLVQTTGASVLDAAGVEAWAAQPGTAMLVFSEEPERFKETLDLAVIVPELHGAHRGGFRVGLLPPLAARASARRYGFARWPAVVMLRDGQYLGAIDGIRDWAEYVDELGRLMMAEPTRPPTVGIPVRTDGAAEAHCH